MTPDLTVLQKALDDTLACFLTLHEGTINPAVAVSGGPDSMALAHLLAQNAPRFQNKSVTALTVDHGLRAESASEAENAGHQIGNWSGITHHILKWEGDKPTTKIQETAREIRFTLLQNYCIDNGLNVLFLAHHMNDQAETILFRLAKGSGIDGLCGMKVFSPLTKASDRTIKIVRPFLGIPKRDLVDYCAFHKIFYAQDPTNKDLSYSRPRLRESMAVLEKEGLSAERLGKTGLRLQRACDALETLAQEAFSVAIVSQKENELIVDFQSLLSRPDEIVIRAVQKAMELINPEIAKGYGPRFEKVETMCKSLINSDKFVKRTLGGCVIARNPQKSLLTIHREKGK